MSDKTLSDELVELGNATRRLKHTIISSIKVFWPISKMDRILLRAAAKFADNEKKNEQQKTKS